MGRWPTLPHDESQDWAIVISVYSPATSNPMTHEPKEVTQHLSDHHASLDRGSHDAPTTA